MAGELFGCSQATISRLFGLLYPLLGQVNADLVAEVQSAAKDAPLLMDGFMATSGERPHAPVRIFSDKHRACGFNVQVLADTTGRFVDVGDPVAGARHDAYAFDASGVAQRWAGHLSPDGPDMYADKGYQGTGPWTPYKKPPGHDLTEASKTCNRAHSSVRSAVEGDFPPNELEDPRHRLAWTAVRAPQPATHRRAEESKRRGLQLSAGQRWPLGRSGLRPDHRWHPQAQVRLRR